MRQNDTGWKMYSRTQDGINEEFVNLLTHGGGLLLAVGGAGVLMHSLTETPNVALRLGCVVYALGLVGVYAASTLSHLFEDPARRRFYRSLDQGVIFLFIASNFTPVALAYMPSSTLFWMMPVMWVAALTGFCSKVFWRHRVESTAISHYLALGWLPATGIEPILRAMPTEGIFWCVAGGLCYTVGTIVLSLDRKVPYFHALWHVLVIAGSFCHFVLVVDYVLPTRS